MNGARRCRATLLPTPAGLDKRQAFFQNGNHHICARIAPHPSGTGFDKECAEAAQFYPISANQRRDHLVENGIDDVLYVTPVYVQILSSDSLHKFRLNHSAVSAHSHAFSSIRAACANANSCVAPQIPSTST